MPCGAGYDFTTLDTLGTLGVTLEMRAHTQPYFTYKYLIFNIFIQKPTLFNPSSHTNYKSGTPPACAPLPDNIAAQKR